MSDITICEQLGSRHIACVCNIDYSVAPWEMITSMAHRRYSTYHNRCCIDHNDGPWMQNGGRNQNKCPWISGNVWTRGLCASVALAVAGAFDILSANGDM